MKKIYIAPSVKVVKCQGQQHILAASLGKARITGDSTPQGDFVTPDETGTGGASEAAVKGMWDY